MPRVSVVIPTFNRRQRLAEALASVREQSFTDHEVIVVDDGSTDGTRELCAGEPGVRYLREEHSGAATARNLGVRHAGGEWIAFLDSDDAWPPDSLARRITLAAERPEVGLVFGDALVENETRGGAARTVSSRRTPHAGRVTAPLLRENFLCTSTVMVRRAALDKVGGFRPEYEPAEDYDLWMRLSEVCAFGFVDAPVARYRVHAGSIGADLSRMFEAEIRVVKDFVGRSGTAGLGAEEIRARLARLHYFAGLLDLEGAPARARHHFARALRQRPWSPRTLAFLAATFVPAIAVPSTRKFLRTHELF